MPTHDRTIAILLWAAAALAMSVGPAARADSAAIARIAFTRGAAYDATSIWTIDPDGTDVVEVTKPGRGAYDDAPVWSPDRSRIAFERQVPRGEDFRGDVIYHEHLTVMNADGTALRRLAVHAHDAAWSPNGRLIAFVKRYAGDEEIWTIRPDGSGGRRVAPGGHPAWSPDGRRIAFDRWTGDRSEVFVMNADGSDVRALMPGFRHEHNAPTWSPDGRRIVFEGCLCGPGFVNQVIYSAQRSGLGLRRLTRGTRPEWSPDGSRLLFQRSLGGGRDATFVIRSTGGPVERVATDANTPDWSPDGREIAFVTARYPGDLRVVGFARGRSTRLAQEAWSVDW